MLTKTLVETGVPGWLVRFDDGWKELGNDVREFLRRGIPCSLAINSALVGDSLRLSWADLRALIGFAIEHGTTLSILQHGATNWSRHGSGANYADFHFELYTRDDVLAELDPSEIERELGVKVSGYVQPGDTHPNRFCTVQRELLISCLRELGYEFAIGLTKQPGASGTLGESGSVWRNSQLFPTYPFEDVGSFHQSSEFKPGVYCDPFLIADQSTMDLGNYVIPRGIANGASAPLPDINSGADGWLLGEDNNGAGAEGDPDADLGSTLQYKMACLLGIGAWQCWAMHGEKRTNTASVALSTGTKAYPRCWSARHVAWLFAALRSKSHVRLLTAREWVSEAIGGFADGAELIANPECNVPLFDIGENSIGDCVLPRGMCGRGFGYIARDAGANFIKGGTEYADGVLQTAANDERILGQFIGEDVLRVPREGYRGGFILRPTEDTAAQSQAFFMFPHLDAGIYRFVIECAGGAAGSATTFDSVGVVGTRARILTRSFIEDAAESIPNAAELEICSLAGSEVYDQNQAPEGDSALGRIVLCFDLDPRKCRPQLFGRVTADPGSIADGASWTSADIAIAGALRGAKGFARASKSVPEGVTLAVNVTSGGVATITAYNDSGAAWAPGSTEWAAYIDDEARQYHPPQEAGVAGPWHFTLGFLVSKDGTSEQRFGEPRLYKVRGY